MAACDIDALKAQAVANRFDQLNPRQLWAAILQELSAWTANSLTPAQLLSQACENGFACVVGRLPLAAAMQLVCNLGDGLLPECVDVIPDGVIYSSEGNYLPPLIGGHTYLLTWGANEVGFTNIGGSPETNPGAVVAGQEVQFVASATTQFVLLGLEGESLVTATICEV